MGGKRIKDKLRTGRPVFTTVLRFHASHLVEMLARSGADQFFLDAGVRSVVGIAAHGAAPGTGRLGGGRTRPAGLEEEGNPRRAAG